MMFDQMYDLRLRVVSMVHQLFHGLILYSQVPVIIVDVLIQVVFDENYLELLILHVLQLKYLKILF
jgi:hypothetical protein